MAYAQADRLPVAKKVQDDRSHFLKVSPKAPVSLHPNQDARIREVSDLLDDAVFFDTDGALLEQITRQAPEHLVLKLPTGGSSSMELWLYKAKVLAEDFRAYASSDPDAPLDLDLGVQYWGVVNGSERSLAAVCITRDEIMGFVQDGDIHYTLGKMDNLDLTILYRTNEFKRTPSKGCDTDDDIHLIGNDLIDHRETDPGTAQSPANCVNLYVEVDQDIVNGKGGVTQAADYVTAAFAQVFILYANESVNMQISEMKLWNTTDPYTGPSTSNYLSQFRTNIGSSFNGDISHLVGYKGGGGIAYVDVLCWKTYAHAYSDINSYFYNVPTYSWTIMVLAHEIGHNLGSRHTHDCAWGPNGNEPIDCCGQNAGYTSNSCGSGYNCTVPNPPSGTIMSYCHLLGSVGIDLNLGFGPQPGDRIRSEVYNAPCLNTCSDACANNGGDADNDGYCADVDCNDNNASINPGASEACDGLDNNCNGSIDEGLPLNTYYVDNDGDGFGVDGNSIQTCDASAPAGYADNNTDCNDNDASAYPGASCDDGDACTEGDALDANCNCQSGSPAPDSDGDGVCDAIDICPGGDDNVDLNGNGTPDFCDCYGETGNFPGETLNHSGAGSSSTSFSFPAGSKHPSFTVSGLNARISGKPSNRFDEAVTVSYVDGDGNTQGYGTFLGSSASTVSVDISGFVQSVSVSLSDDLGNNSASLSVSLSAIDFCSAGPACPDADLDGTCDSSDVCPGFDDSLIGAACDDGDDCSIGDTYTANCECVGTPTGDSDGDGVCDALDVCPGGDDKIDSDGDGVPDFCDNSNCTEVISSFSVNPLTHGGSGASSSSVSIGGNSDVVFTISGLDDKQKGKQDRMYIEEVTVTYIDGGGQSQTYGAFRGDQVSTVNVSIAGAVQSVTVSLADVLTGSTASNMQVDLSDATSCASSLPESSFGAEGPLVNGGVEVYPNPSAGYVYLRFKNSGHQAVVEVFDLTGRSYGSHTISAEGEQMIDLRNTGLINQVVLLKIRMDEEWPVIHRVMLVQ